MKAPQSSPIMCTGYTAPTERIFEPPGSSCLANHLSISLCLTWPVAFWGTRPLYFWTASSDCQSRYLCLVFRNQQQRCSAEISAAPHTLGQEFASVPSSAPRSFCQEFWLGSGALTTCPARSIHPSPPDRWLRGNLSCLATSLKPGRNQVWHPADGLASAGALPVVVATERKRRLLFYLEMDSAHARWSWPSVAHLRLC